MNVLKTYYKHQKELEHEDFLRREKEEAEAYAKMTDEEKKAYDEEKRKRREHLNSLLSIPYQIGNLNYYK